MAMERLMLVTARHAVPGGAAVMVERIAQALRAVPPGSTFVQLREKDLEGRALVELGRAIVAVARATGARVVVNDRVDVALAIGAAGVHLPEVGMSVSEARSALPPGGLVGASVHDVAGVRGRAAADYLVLGPVWDTPGKRASGLGGLRDAVAAAAGTPVFAIGGIDLAHADEAAEAGAWGVAAIRSILSAADPGATSAALVEAVLNR